MMSLLLIVTNCTTTRVINSYTSWCYTRIVTDEEFLKLSKSSKIKINVLETNCKGVK